jgi:hypothetical protein
VNRIKPALDGTRKSIVIFALGFGIPTVSGGIAATPRDQTPIARVGVCHSVGKSKSNEVNCSFLLPARKTIRCKTNVIVRIEELELGHFQGAAVS